MTSFDLVRVMLGATLLAACGFKGHDFLAGEWDGGDRFLPRWLTIGLIEAEWILGLWLLSGLYSKAAWLLSLLAFSIFACAALAKAVLGETACGCFGKLNLSPWGAFLFDLAALFALVAFRAGASRSITIKSHPLRAAWFATIAFWPGILWHFAALNVSDQSIHIVIKPSEWTGKRLPILQYIDVSDVISQGDWLIVFFRHNCPECLAKLPEYDRMAREWSGHPDKPRVALIEAPPYANPPGVRSLYPDSRCVFGRLDRSKAWTVETPSEIRLRDRIVVSEH